jgi:hypothetical protein
MSLAQPAQPSTPGSVLERIEEEIHRLREKRPYLDDIIDRATNILLTHLSCPRQRVIRVRVGLDGRPKFLVASLNERGATYVINPLLWACSCPAFHRRGRPCKHSLAAYVLWRAAQPVARKRTCSSCAGRFPVGQMIEVQEEHESLTWFVGDMLCDGCVAAYGGLA